jgi:hypothetical protein
LERDGFGREAWWWFASAYIDGRQRTRRWSVDKYGDRGAWRLAMAQRREWESSTDHIATSLNHGIVSLALPSTCSVTVFRPSCF